MAMRLILMRHAKSSWKAEAASDHERPLNSRGRKDAPRIAKVLKRMGWWPDLVLSSDSERTRQTWELMAGIDETAKTSVQYLNDLYLAGLSDIQTVLYPLASSTGSVLLLGHNPGWEEAASYLSGVNIEMTTANCVLLEADHMQWHGSCERLGSWRLVQVLRPRELED